MFCEFASCHKIVVSRKIVLRSSVNLGPGNQQSARFLRVSMVKMNVSTTLLPMSYTAVQSLVIVANMKASHRCHTALSYARLYNVTLSESPILR